MNRVRALLGGMLVAISLSLAACKGGVIPIKTLLDDPSQYESKTVRVAGDVEEAAGVLGYGIYRVNDGTGTITVLTQAGGVPRTGAKVGVEGQFKSAFTLGTETLAVIMEKQRSAQ